MLAMTPPYVLIHKSSCLVMSSQVVSGVAPTKTKEAFILNQAEAYGRRTSHVH